MTLIGYALAALAINPDAAVIDVPKPNAQPAFVVRAANEIELRWAFPKPEYRASGSGSANISCGISENGQPHDCNVTSESPAERGYGEAALKVVQFMTFSAAASDDKPTAGNVSFTVNFKNPKFDSQPNWKTVPDPKSIPQIIVDSKGLIVVGCMVQVNGDMDSCELLRATVSNEAAETAAIKFVSSLKFVPAVRNGRPVAAPVAVPLRSANPLAAGAQP